MSEPLGPAVTESFPAAVGLHELLTPEKRASAPGASPSPAPTAPAPTPEPEVPAVEFSPKLFLNALRVLDRISSKLLKVEPESPEMVGELSEAIAPLVQYYGKSKSTVGALWGNLVVVLLGFTFAKYEKVEARQRAAHPTDDTPPAEEEESNEPRKGTGR